MPSFELPAAIDPRRFAKLAVLPDVPGLAFRRPLLVALIFGCAVSLLTSGRLTLRLAGPATVYWSFVPLCEIASLAVFCAGRRRSVSFARAIDLFFIGNLPWSILLIVFAAVWAWVPAVDLFSAARTWRIWYAAALLAAAWSACIDFWFFRRVLARSAGGALRDLLCQRLLCWAAVIACFAWSGAWTIVAPRLGL